MPKEPDYSRYGARRPVSGGVHTRTARGPFGRTTWGRALIEAVEAMSDPGRLARGRSYARSGQVVSYTIEPGAAVAEVQGSQPRPFTAAITVRRLRPEEQELLIEAIRDTPGTLANITSGVLPVVLSAHLLPETAADLDFDCTCPDSGWPCKHAAALCYVLADRLDENPRDLLTLRGISLDTLIASMERARSTPTEDLYGNTLVLPDLPTPEYHPALDDLDPALLRQALRALAEDEPAAASALRQLTTFYANLRDR